MGYDEDVSAIVSLKLFGCPEGSSPVIEIEMMHVWFFDHPDGPLAPHLPPKAATVIQRSLQQGDEQQEGNLPTALPIILRRA